MKYIIELEKMEETDLYRVKGTNTIMFTENGIKSILTPYEEKTEVDWYKVPKDTKVLVWDHDEDCAQKRYFSHFDGKTYYAFPDGATYWSGGDGARIAWSHCKLAEGNK